MDARLTFSLYGWPLKVGGPTTRMQSFSVVEGGGVMTQARRSDVAAHGQLLCRFSDAGNEEASTCSGGRRLKSAEARNRGEVGHRRCRGLYGDLAAALGWGGWIKAPAPTGCPCRMAVSDAQNERSGRCRTGLAVSLRTDLSTGSKRGRYWPKASEDRERHWAGGPVATAS